MKKPYYILFALLISNKLYCQQWYSMGNLDTFGINVYQAKYVPGITFYNNKITIGGDFKKDGSTVLNGIAQWSGYNWQPMGLGVWWDQLADSSGNG